MPRSRRHDILRRAFLTAIKHNPDIFAKRFKKLGEIPPGIDVKPPEEEWAFEWTVLEQLELMAFEVFEAEDIPEAYWPYYLGYLKRVWERMMNFTGPTLETELDSLRWEYQLRGWSLPILNLLEPIAQYTMEWKKSGEVDESLFSSRFKVALSAPQVIPSGPQTVVQFDDKTSQVLFDQLDEFNLTTHRFVALNAGYYFFRFQLVYTAFPVGSDYYGYVNWIYDVGNMLLTHVQKECLVIGNDYAQGSIAIELAEGDSVEIQTQHGTGAGRTLQSGPTMTVFEGFRFG